jgi:hypothetical protein
MAAEIELLPVLARAVPGAVVEPLAADRARGFLLLPDAGPTVADLHPDAALPPWRTALAGYARLQHAASPFAAELLAAGALDLRPREAADLLTDLAERDDLHEQGNEHALTAEELARLRDVAVPGARAAAAALADAAVPVTIQHDDLSPSNALVDGRWLDWGDASVAHPFASLLTALDGTSGRTGQALARSPPARAVPRRLGRAHQRPGRPAGARGRPRRPARPRRPGTCLAAGGAGRARALPGSVSRWLRRLAHAEWPTAG